MAEETRVEEAGRDGHSLDAPHREGETPFPEKNRQATEIHRSYYQWLRLSRLALIAFFAMACFFFFWILPWMPSGLDADDYTPELAFTVYLLAGMGITGILALGARELVRRKREGLIAWSAVYDEATGLHNRTFLYDRLSLECERAEHSGGVFYVIILQIRLYRPTLGPLPTLSNAMLQQIAELINRLTRRSDLVALLGGSELAILAFELGRESQDDLLERLRNAVATELSRLLDESAMVNVAGGVVTYGTQGKEPAALIHAARVAAAFGTLPRSQAA